MADYAGHDRNQLATLERPKLQALENKLEPQLSHLIAKAPVIAGSPLCVLLGRAGGFHRAPLLNRNARHAWGPGRIGKGIHLGPKAPVVARSPLWPNRHAKLSRR